MGEGSNKRDDRKDCILISLISVIVLLGVLIFIHELGHFLAARIGGVGVVKFSLGFGPKIFGKKIGETEYVLSWIPLGGFVKLFGESENESLSPEDERRSFLKQPTWKKMLIVLAGPVFNFLLALVIFVIIFMYGVPNLTTEIGEVQKQSAAYNAGLISGDKIISIDGKTIKNWEDLRPVIAAGNGKETEIIVERQAEKKHFLVKPMEAKSKNVFGEEISTYLIGVSPSGKTVIERKNPWEATIAAGEKTWEISKLTILALVKMVEGTISPRTLGGPIFIAQVAGAQVKEGIIPFILFMALLSINLGVINLFPIPVLDGGHIMFYAIEMVLRREISIKVKELAQQIGFAILAMLMIFVIMIDIERMNLPIISDIFKYFK
ncbi:MAG: RIP metalloprotease RseP [Deltaproteobacteria bacterium HGW-Deltaproteobacteria-12]|nr:MAG: RIP metalloprotease RseP [Deltaproteobacteria bacterium HGW-Deltaproteobacteria-12]